MASTTNVKSELLKTGAIQNNSYRSNHTYGAMLFRHNYSLQSLTLQQLLGAKVLHDVFIWFSVAQENMISLPLNHDNWAWCRLLLYMQSGFLVWEAMKVKVHVYSQLMQRS